MSDAERIARLERLISDGLKALKDALRWHPNDERRQWALAAAECALETALAPEGQPAPAPPPTAPEQQAKIKALTADLGAVLVQKKALVQALEGLLSTWEDDSAACRAAKAALRLVGRP